MMYKIIQIDFKMQPDFNAYLFLCTQLKYCYDAFVASHTSGFCSLMSKFSGVSWVNPKNNYFNTKEGGITWQIQLTK